MKASLLCVQEGFPRPTFKIKILDYIMRSIRYEYCYPSDCRIRPVLTQFCIAYKVSRW